MKAANIFSLIAAIVLLAIMLPVALACVQMASTAFFGLASIFASAWMGNSLFLLFKGA